MTATALGTWRRPPLVYVVAELVISPYYSMAAKVPSLQDRLRSSFPRTIEAKEIIVSFGVIQADDYDAAVAIARECPPGHTIEIRELAGYA